MMAKCSLRICMDEHLSLMLSVQLAPRPTLPPALILLAENFGGGEGEISGSFPLQSRGEGGLLC